MRIIAADDERIALDQLVKTIKKVNDTAEIRSFQNPKKLLEYAEKNSCDVAFLDIEMGALTGIDVAKQLKLWYPKINIIFVTGYDEYMREAFKLRVSGYVEKPVTENSIKEELEGLRMPISFEAKDKLTVRCFGNFDASVNGESLEFERTKSKEMLAYLIDRRGSVVSSGEIRTALWRDYGSDKKSGTYFQKIKKDLLNTLKRHEISDVLVSSWNKYAVDPTKINCDYYAYLEDKPEGIRAYNGEYMSQYDWAHLRK